MRTLEVDGVRVLESSAAPVLLLKDVADDRCLPIWIGAAEASAVVSALEGLVPPRPLTHDLFAVVLAHFVGTDDIAIEIRSVEDGIFKASLKIGTTTFDARPSDGVALALRLGIDITCTDELMREAGVELSAGETDEVEAFKEFLDSVNADDFEGENPSQD